VGIVLRNFREVVSGVQRMLDPATLAEFRKNVGALENRAIFEIPEILEKLSENPRMPKRLDRAELRCNQFVNTECLRLELTGERARAILVPQARPGARIVAAVAATGFRARRRPPARRVFRHLAHFHAASQALALGTMAVTSCCLR